jgi:transposase
VRKIARHLHLARRTISQYLATPARSAARRPRASKLDAFKATIAELLEQDAKASAMVIAQRLRPLGFTGERVWGAFVFPLVSSRLISER